MGLFATGAGRTLNLTDPAFGIGKGLFGNNENGNKNTLWGISDVQKTGQKRGKEFSMEHITAKTVDRSLLKDIRNVVIDTSKPCKERIKGYIEQIGNPYCYLDDGVVVEIGYANTGVSLQERLVAYASSIDQDFGNLR